MLDPHGRGSSDGTPSRPAAAIVLAAGEGTRMRSAVPKVLHRIGGRSLLGHAVHAAAALEPEHLVVVVGAGGEQVREALTGMADELARPVLAAEQHQRLGTGHAVRCALDALPDDLSGPVLVTYGDVPLLASDTLSALLHDHASYGAPLTVLTSAVDDPTGYGRVLHATDGTVSRIVEERDASLEERAVKEINSGVYAFDAAFLLSAIGRLRTDNNQGELYLTDLVTIARADGADARGVRCPDAWQVRGINDRVQLAALRAELNRRLLERAPTAAARRSGPARPSGRSPTCVPARGSGSAARSAPSSRSRTRTSARAPRCRISRTSATPRSASTATSARPRCS
jgi:bifunctional UDP-N-acetylglucosamine pyrophosphorylase / glucosamine-1-phosphate N-acetyltransferase